MPAARGHGRSALLLLVLAADAVAVVAFAAALSSGRGWTTALLTAVAAGALAPLGLVPVLAIAGRPAAAHRSRGPLPTLAVSPAGMPGQRRAARNPVEAGVPAP